jgi:hypothetical protein
MGLPELKNFFWVKNALLAFSKYINMKSFKEYLIENPALEVYDDNRSPVTVQLPKDYSNFYSLGTMNVDNNEYHFHGYSVNRNSPFQDERFHSGYITVKTPSGEHKVVGNTDFYSHVSGKDVYDSNLPKLQKEHSGKGLMSELYKRWADHNKYTLISGRVHTRGGKNIWAELSQKGTVTAHNTDREGSRPIVYDSKNPKHIAKFYRGGRSPSSSPTKWVFKYKGT